MSEEAADDAWRLIASEYRIYLSVSQPVSPLGHRQAPLSPALLYLLRELTSTCISDVITQHDVDDDSSQIELFLMRASNYISGISAISHQARLATQQLFVQWFIWLLYCHSSAAP